MSRQGVGPWATARRDVGLAEALFLTLDRLGPLPPTAVPVAEASGYVAAADLATAIDCPAAPSSLKDGYALSSRDVAGATPECPVRLHLAGSAFAGGEPGPPLRPGCAVRVTTGARLPEGADAVLTSEFTEERMGVVLCLRDAGPGRNILPRGADVALGACLATRGTVITPARAGLLAAAGLNLVEVHPRPSVGVLATGDEIVLPGEPLRPGQLYASNLVTLLGWLRRFGLHGSAARAEDCGKGIAATLADMLATHDAVLTSGGAWKSERDLTVRVVAELGGELLYERVRIGPGKAMAFALVGGKPVFCLPGGPASNEMAFLQLALPGLLRMAGLPTDPFPRTTAVLAAPLEGTEDWTQFFQATLEERDGTLVASPLRGPSRLRAQAEAEALVSIPEGVRRLEAGATVGVQLLTGFPGGFCQSGARSH